MYQPQDFEKCYIFMTAVIKDYNLKVHFPGLNIHVFDFSMFCQLQGKKLRVKYELWLPEMSEVTSTPQENTATKSGKSGYSTN